MNDIFNYTDKNINGLTDELKAIFLAKKYKKFNKTILLVTNTLFEANQMYNNIKNYENNVLLFPMDDFLTSEALAISPELKITRIETLEKLLETKKNILVTNLMGYLRFLPSKTIFQKSYIHFEINKNYNFNQLITKLYNIGYKKETIVNVTGEMSIRGFVIDIFPLLATNPVRLEFFGDCLESIRIFDINTQRTIKKINNYKIIPITEKLSEKGNYNICNYLTNFEVFFNNYDEIKLSYNKLQKEMEKYSLSIGKNKNTIYMNNLNEHLCYNQFFLNTFGDTYKTKELLPFNDNLSELNLKLNKLLNSHVIILCISNKKTIAKLEKELNNSIITNEKNIISKKINIINFKINKGFEINNILVISEKEIFNSPANFTYNTKFRYGTRINDISKINKGDYIVHYIYGIGKYLGLKTILKNNYPKDYLHIEYKDGDKLYIPVEKIDNISKYSTSDGYKPKLSKLGSNEWKKSKIRARKKAEDIAQELLQTFSLRETKKGISFLKDTKEQYEFEKEFIYEETSDQLKVWHEIKNDMESIHPMDRLLCGDVGYGKTEIAFRAIFKAILSNKQVAFLCPTTILSMQHYKNAKERFKNYPVNIEILNRFVPSKKVQEIITKLKAGKIDCLIGTHRILSEDIQYKNLGFLVIDEEQRFGVKQKEKIKQYRNNIDILTLSATPIPRTLQMSISGIRSLSIIETPPVDRYPIQTYVMSENQQIIKEVIYKELSRNGQIFILYNNVKNIQNKLSQLKQLIPEALIAVAHGQMDKNDLEKVMIDFVNQKYNILLCTTIIETGIDIPTVNTLIVIDADRFGLSQLYQLRGRIGRSNKLAYCYLTYNNKKILSEIAKKRLQSIKDFTELGSGFSIAMRDLSIRGAGDILGKEQAGFIESVGIELFMEMVKEEIDKINGKKLIKNKEDNLLLDIKTSIPDNYVDEEELKIEIHKKINTIDSFSKLLSVKEELEDRFGKINEDLNIYMHEQLLEKEISKLNILRINQKTNYIEIIMNKNFTNKIKIEDLFVQLSSISKNFRFSIKFDKLYIIFDLNNLSKNYIFYLLDMTQIIKKML